MKLINGNAKSVLSRSGYASSILVLLVALTVLTSATSSCPSASSFPVVCYCADSDRTETIYTQSTFLKAREDPSSCCYSKKADPKVVSQEHIHFTFTSAPPLQNTPSQEAITPQSDRLPPNSPIDTTTIPQASKVIASSSSNKNPILASSTTPPTLEIQKKPVQHQATFKVTALKPDYTKYSPAIISLLKRKGFNI